MNKNAVGGKYRGEDEEDDEEEEESDDVMDVDSEDESPKRKGKYSGKNSSTRKQLLRTGSWAPTFCDAAEGARRLKEAASQDANAPPCLPLLLPSLSGLLASDVAEYAAQYPPPPQTRHGFPYLYSSARANRPIGLRAADAADILDVI